MGCSDRFDDLPYCSFGSYSENGRFYNTCSRRPTHGVYCEDHAQATLRKQDAANVIKQLKNKQKDKLHEWLDENKA